jgi:hypothetical protein
LEGFVTLAHNSPLCAVFVPNLLNFQSQMEQTIICKYWNPKLKIAFKDWQQVFILSPVQKQLRPEVYKGNLVYRIPGSFKRIAYSNIKSGLVKKSVSVKVPYNLLPF